MTYLLVDTHNIAYRLAFRAASNGNKINTEQQKKMFIVSFFGEIEKIVGDIGISKYILVFCKDQNSSWRKEIYPEYKGKRNKDYPFSIDNFFLCVDEITRVLESLDMKTIGKDKLEADDLISITSNLFNFYKRNCVIVSSDNDYKQKVNNNKVGWTVFYNTDKKRFYRHKDDMDENEDMFSLTDSAETVIMKNSDIINPSASLLCKILVGDDSDNIPSCFKYLIKNSLKGFTELRFDQMYAVSSEKIDSLDVNDTKEVYELLFSFLSLNVKGFISASFDHESFSTGYLKNKKLVELEDSHVPRELLLDGINEITTVFSTPTLSRTFSKRLFENTEYDFSKKEKSFLDI